MRLYPRRAELEGQLGRVEDAALLRLHERHAALQRWQQQLGPPARKGKAPAAPPGFGGGKAAPAAATTAGQQGLPDVPTLSAEEAVLAVCGLDAETAAAVYAAAAGDGSAAATRAAFAAAMAAPAPPPPRVATAAEQAAVEAEVFGAKGRVLNAQAGARWLVQWCGRVAGGAADDTVTAAVCRLLLSSARAGLLERASACARRLPWVRRCGLPPRVPSERAACHACTRSAPLPRPHLATCRPRRRRGGGRAV